jgi:hypothetical protein
MQSQLALTVWTWTSRDELFSSHDRISSATFLDDPEIEARFTANAK